MTNEEIRDARNRMHTTGECPQCGQVAAEYPPHIRTALDGKRWAAAPHKEGCPLHY